MMTKQPNILEFTERFPTDDACLEHLMRVRYGERHACSKCGREARYYRVKKRYCYECEHCGHQVYPQVGTPFEKSRTSLRKWFLAMYMFCASRHGVSAKELERSLGVTYKTAWRMARLIREYMGYIDGDGPIGGQGIIEVDKAYLGGVDRRGHDDKAIVLGMTERGGEVVTRIVPDKTNLAVTPHVLATVRRGTRVATDSAQTYNLLREEGYHHATVNHQKKEYVRGEVHTNTLEGFWALIQRSIRSTHIWVSRKHLQTYLGAFEFVWNLRHDPHLMLDLMLSAFPKPAVR